MLLLLLLLLMTVLVDLRPTGLRPVIPSSLTVGFPSDDRPMQVIVAVEGVVAAAADSAAGRVRSPLLALGLTGVVGSPPLLKRRDRLGKRLVGLRGRLGGLDRVELARKQGFTRRRHVKVGRDGRKQSR